MVPSRRKDQILAVLILLGGVHGFGSVSRQSSSRSRDDSRFKTENEQRWSSLIGSYLSLQREIGRPNYSSWGASFVTFASIVDDVEAVANVDDDASDGESSNSTAKDASSEKELSLEEQLEKENLEANMAINRLAIQDIYRGQEKRAMGLLRGLRSPDTISYHSVLKVLAKFTPRVKQNPMQADALLEEMLSVHAKQLAAKEEWIARRASGLMTEEEELAGPPRVWVKPNARSYSAVADVWGRASNATRAEEVFRMLQQRYNETGDAACQPGTIVYNVVLAAYARAGLREEGIQKCFELLKEMGDLANCVSYNNVLMACSRSRSPTAGRKAQKIFDSIPRDIEMDLRTYVALIDAWARSFGCPDAAKNAHAILTKLEKMGKRNKEFTPNVYCYSAVINAYAYSTGEPLKAYRAYELYKKVMKLARGDIRLYPNTITLNAVLNACASSACRSYGEAAAEQGLKDIPSLPSLVREVYARILLDSDDPDRSKVVCADEYTFGTVLKAAGQVFWGEGDQVEFAVEAFHEACRRGRVSFGVVRQLKLAVPIDVFRSLLPADAIVSSSGFFSMDKIPKEWKKNCRELYERGRGQQSP